jgi:hypothetical protein
LSGGSATTEDQSNVVSHPHTISTRGHACPWKY